MAKQVRADVPPIEAALARLTGARLCYGKPISVGQRTIVPVASVRTLGGFGYGKNRGEESGDGSGGGGGGTLEAHPVGFIEITPEGTRYQAITDSRLSLAAIAGGALAAIVAARSFARRRRAHIATAPRRTLRARIGLPYPSSQRS
jgi:uncharacterized spore protein YtfJ